MPAPQRARITYSIFPAELHIGDRFTDADGEWEIASRPLAFTHGHEIRARVRRIGDPRTLRNISWPAQKRLAIRRPS
ncbi:MAG: hypothetical protein DMD36_17545 [Gemmatimonadetes bacterium]|nr:MAG: hypothetical protein DMD36_17545 [Gemmatimonadota bacterium]